MLVHFNEPRQQSRGPALLVISFILPLLSALVFRAFLFLSFLSFLYFFRSVRRCGSWRVPRPPRILPPPEGGRRDAGTGVRVQQVHAPAAASLLLSPDACNFPLAVTAREAGRRAWSAARFEQLARLHSAAVADSMLGPAPMLAVRASHCTMRRADFIILFFFLQISLSLLIASPSPSFFFFSAVPLLTANAGRFMLW